MLFSKKLQKEKETVVLPTKNTLDLEDITVESGFGIFGRIKEPLAVQQYFIIL